MTLSWVLCTHMCVNPILQASFLDLWKGKNRHRVRNQLCYMHRAMTHFEVLLCRIVASKDINKLISETLEYVTLYGKKGMCADTIK